MNNLNFHPVLKEPPNAHALHKWNGETKTLTYEYNGTDIISIHVPDSEDAGFRHGSDGSMQSMQYFQQIYVTVEKPMKAEMIFNLCPNAINMRPHRAGGNEAILGQTGQPLIAGVNGIYDIDWDLLIDWNGCSWRWLSAQIEHDEAGRSVARLEVELCEKPLFINIRPQYYRKHLGYTYHKPWEFKPKQLEVAGWCSWEAYRRNISIDKIKHISEFMEQKLKDYGLKYILVDDGYQKMPLPFVPEATIAEGWLTCEESKFPGGHESIVSSISSCGLSPAVWTNANITNKDFPNKHPKDIIWHEGKPLKGEWIDFLYSCTPETLEKHVTPLFEKLKELGYEYIKIDAIRHLLFDGLHECVRLGIMTNDDAEKRFRTYMEAVRRGLGNDVYFLASWGEMGEVIGVVDACRISMDANPTWAGVRMQLFESARWFHAQRILFLNDPDHVCVRTKAEWAKSVLSLISLSGGLYMLSDTADAYTDEKLDIIRRTLPPLKTRTAETGSLSVDYPAYTWTKLHGFAVQSHETPVEMEEVSLKDALDMAGNFPTMDDLHPFSTLWAFHLTNAGRGWCIMGRFATVPLSKGMVELSALGLDKSKCYAAFDFWQKKYLGDVTEAIECKALGIGECQIVSLYELKGEPQIIASDRHVSMDAVSILKHEYKGGILSLSLEGIPQTTWNYYLHAPKKSSLISIESQGADVKSEQSGEITTITVSFNEKHADLTLKFS